MDIRRAEKSDLADICDIAGAAARDTWASFNTEPDTPACWLDRWRRHADRFPWFVAQTDGKVVGFARALPFMDRCGFTQAAEVSVYVDPAHAGRRVGTALYASLIPALSDAKFATVIAAIALPNPVCERLHESFGFHRVGLLARVGFKFGEWHDLAYWQLELGEGTEGLRDEETQGRRWRDQGIEMPCSLCGRVLPSPPCTRGD